MMRALGRHLKRLHRDEQGADMVEYILIIAAIALPLLAVLIVFRDELWGWVNEFFDNITGNIEVPN